ncbi:hypothetical protein PMI08_02140 [Brevibacillus sp. CF112]|uniref:hypothetical protein n=1 Tax=Brevibacillus TaxID=55080 RepID=UPI000271BB83|nr:hypothetical protein [Brevibacillus sp. CF112]EJL44022.1 hypothetical protein PMI08_02140 [Brevibacillus sp. CF112]
MTKVLKDFRCKVTKQLFRTGDKYDGERTEELQALGYVSEEPTDGEGEKKSERKSAKKNDGR